MDTVLKTYLCEMLYWQLWCIQNLKLKRLQPILLPLPPYSVQQTDQREHSVKARCFMEDNDGMLSSYFSLLLRDKPYVLMSVVD